jgi:UDP-N-acetyl-2-amino-2-deoxyglucuronate dehydrogenase
VASTAVFPGFAQRLEITGTDGTLTIEDGAIVRRAFGASGQEPDSGPPAAGTPGAGTPGAGTAATGSNPAAVEAASHAAQIADLLDAVEDGREPAVGGEAGRAALEIVCAVYESARTGRAVALGR